MKIAGIVFVILAFALSSLLPSFNASGAVVLKDEEIRRTVGALINSENRVHIQAVKIEINRDGLLDLEITTNLGNCWGKKEAMPFSSIAMADASPQGVSRQC